ncbi:glycosyltransferase family 4 protein [Sulfurimonas microaerophilic]|uniref:glycosyltransferase family 4 protein n=1 Tax=Sulfurimonas microaerophilic TaxID=3058392 RepID=UPI00271531A3|nr:MraY family glycosyltransferase [Sulfurimonas sp. hsl 1-7]
MIENFLITFFIAFIVIYALIKLKGIVRLNDIPNERSLHTKTIPRSGGLGIFVSLLIFFVYMNFFDGKNVYLLFSIFMVFLLGFYDDIFSANPKFKLLVIFIASLVLSLDGVYLTSLGEYLGFNLTLGFFAIPFTAFAIIGFTNALNLIDGLDGLAGGVSLIILLAFAHIGNEFDDIVILTLSTGLLGALSAFLFFNWNPAKIFMGDSGSLTIGFILAVLALLSSHYIHPVAILYFLAVPVIDTLIVMIRRIKYQGSPFKADNTHIHHILNDFFGSAKQTTFFLMMSQAIFCFLGYVVARHIESYPLGLFPVAMIISFVILTIMAYMLFTTILKNKGELKK